MGRSKLTPREEALKPIIASNINRYLESTNKKPADLQRGTGIAQSTISDYTGGKTLTSPGNAEKIASFFGVLKSDIDPRFGDDWVSENEYPIIEKTVNVMKKMKTDRQEKVLFFAKSELGDQNKVMEIADYQTENEYPYYDDAVSAGTGQYIGTSQRETITLPVDFDADYVVPVNGDSMEPEYHDGDYIFIESTVNLNDGEIGVFELYGGTYVKQLILEDDHAYLHSLNKKYKDMKVDADSDFRVLGRVIGRYAEN